MNVDMKKIKLSPFWLAVIAAFAVLLIGLFPMVLTQKGKVGKRSRDLKRTAEDVRTAKEGTPSKADIESWNKFRSDVTRAYKEVTDFYTTSDKYLERWFPGILLQSDGNPSRDVFMATFRDAGEKLEASLTGKDVKIGVENEDPTKKPKFGFNWEAVTPNDWGLVVATNPADELAVLRELQKRYWARQRLANMILNGGVKVNRIVDFRFFKKLHEKLQNAPWEQFNQAQGETIHWQGVNAGQNGQPMGGFVETDLPNDLGKTLTFGFAIELPYTEVPKAIREILNPGNEASATERMLVNLIGTHVTIREQNEPVITFQHIKGDKADEDAKRAAALAKFGGDKPRPVLLAVTCQIIDFDPAKVKKFEKAN